MLNYLKKKGPGKESDLPFINGLVRNLAALCALSLLKKKLMNSFKGIDIAYDGYPN